MEKLNIMNELDILKKCFHLVWYHGEMYDKYDIEEFKDKHLYLWSQYDDVLAYLDKLEKGE